MTAVEYVDAFKNEIKLGDEVASFTYKDHRPFRGIIIQLGKNQVKVQYNHRVRHFEETRWVRCANAIRTRTKEEIERQN